MDDFCTCGTKFRTGEDYRDHLPCPGTKEQQEIVELRAENERLRATLRTMVELKGETNRCQQERTFLGPQCQLEANHEGAHMYPITELWGK
jgi:hypothetical protein